MTTTIHPATILVIEDDDASRLLVTYLPVSYTHLTLPTKA